MSVEGVNWFWTVNGQKLLDPRMADRAAHMKSVYIGIAQQQLQMMRDAMPAAKLETARMDRVYNNEARITTLVSPGIAQIFVDLLLAIPEINEPKAQPKKAVEELAFPVVWASNKDGCAYEFDIKKRDFTGRKVVSFPTSRCLQLTAAYGYLFALSPNNAVFTKDLKLQRATLTKDQVIAPDLEIILPSTTGINWSHMMLAYDGMLYVIIQEYYSGLLTLNIHIINPDTMKVVSNDAIDYAQVSTKFYSVAIGKSDSGPVMVFPINSYNGSSAYNLKTIIYNIRNRSFSLEDTELDQSVSGGSYIVTNTFGWNAVPFNSTEAEALTFEDAYSPSKITADMNGNMWYPTHALHWVLHDSITHRPNMPEDSHIDRSSENCFIRVASGNSPSNSQKVYEHTRTFENWGMEEFIPESHSYMRMSMMLASTNNRVAAILHDPTAVYIDPWSQDLPKITLRFFVFNPANHEVKYFSVDRPYLNMSGEWVGAGDLFLGITGYSVDGSSLFGIDQNTGQFMVFASPSELYFSRIAVHWERARTDGTEDFELDRTRFWNKFGVKSVNINPG
jgi:hypothetical protein